MSGATSPIIDVRLLDGPLATPSDPLPGSCGGECLFLGRTREERHPEHGHLQRLDYEAHPTLALRELDAIARDVARDHGCAVVRIWHATGRVPVGAVSVAIQVGTGHRAEAFAACRMAIDQLKERAPIWKREVWTDASTRPDGVVARAASIGGKDSPAC